MLVARGHMQALLFTLYIQHTFLNLNGKDEPKVLRQLDKISPISNLLFIPEIQFKKAE
jgi:hypothetical protein